MSSLPRAPGALCSQSGIVRGWPRRSGCWAAAQVPSRIVIVKSRLESRLQPGFAALPGRLKPALPILHSGFFDYQLLSVGVERGHHTFGKGELVVGVADGQARQHRDLQIVEDVVHDLAKRECRIERWLVVRSEESRVG